jgi:hypothetical protein
MLMVPCCQSHAGGAEKDELESIVQKFCDSAMLYDRGIAISFFVPSIDELVVKELVRHTGFRECFGISLQQAEDIKAQATKRQRMKNVVEAEPWLDISAFPRVQQRFRLALDGQLTEKQQQLLLAIVYLNREGLMALRRDTLGQVMELKLEQRMEIGRIAEELWNGKVMNLGRQQFVLRSDEVHRNEVHPSVALQLEIRRTSQELDRAIARMLDDAQLTVLSQLINTGNQMAIGTPLLDSTRVWSSDFYDADRIRLEIGQLEDRLSRRQPN